VNEAVIGVGSNIDPHRNVARARELIAAECELVEESPFVRTTPIGSTDQADFLNGAFLIRTPLDRRRFVARLKAIESRLGRIRTANRYGPRTIDLDLVVWNGMVVDRDYHSRDFLRRSVRTVLEQGASELKQ
jgi:2-amino-4-hydroxy-6-hydroxymethyldihydropteridine diphosphokinase